MDGCPRSSDLHYPKGQVSLDLFLNDLIQLANENILLGYDSMCQIVTIT